MSAIWPWREARSTKRFHIRPFDFVVSNLAAHDLDRKGSDGIDATALHGPGKSATVISLQDGTVQPARRFYTEVGKGIFDRTVGLALLVVAAPFMAVLAIMTRVALGRKILYIQERVGQNEQIFKMYKFRTMLPDRRHSDRLPPFGERRKQHKDVNDPRHTALGRWLRRRSLDELPQLWNVVRGDMSLVGPRPELPLVVSRYEPWQHLRHAVKPGVTGIWQTTARNYEDGSRLCDHTELDLLYIQQISLGMDLRILSNTVVVMCRVGAGGS
jgi:lipopolysaccharide/colanic/teichoic acid biosynthesis glycosyltransferase